MIRSFGDITTDNIFNGTDSKFARKIPKSIWPAAGRKLDILNAAHDLKDLRIPPSNMLEKLKGNLSEYYSIRINK